MARLILNIRDGEFMSRLTPPIPLFRPAFLILAVCIFFIGFTQDLHGQTTLWSGVIDPSRAIDWSKVGATISTNRTQCATSACATVSGGTVTAASINAALASAPAGTYVLIPAGSFTMNAGIDFGSRSNITLRGSGSNSTFLSWSGSSGHDINVSSSDVNYSGGPTNTANWTGTNGVSGTYTKGATSITLSSTSNLAVGSQLILDQIDNQSDPGIGALYMGCELPDGSAACYSGAESDGFARGSSLSNIRGQQQIVNVTAISGNTVSITPGIYASNYATSHSPGAWWASSPVSGDAIENISLDHTNGGDGITFFNCTGCWVKGIRSVRNSQTGTAWGHVYFAICNHCTVRDSYFYGYAGDTYGISVEIASDSLIENNIFHYFLASQFYNSDCEGCVASYNFSVGTNFGSSGQTWMGNSAEFHGVNLFALSEGNIGAGMYEDSFHGTHALNTQFRNRWDGHEQNQGVQTASNTVALRLNPGSRFNNAIGNVLGTVGYHTTYKSAYNASSNTVYASAIDNGSYPETSTYDNLTGPTSMFWGNWDNVTNAVRWCGNSSNAGWATTCGSTSEVPSTLAAYANPVPSTTTLPASFLYSAQPSWWPSGKKWPAIGPDVTGGNVGQCVGGTYATSEATSSSQCSGGTFTPLSTVVSIPAMDCYLNVMGGVSNGQGSALAFDASKCYTVSMSTISPSSPTNLKGTVTPK
jgi:hypothetical protein